MVGTWIINSVSPKIQASIIYRDTSLEIQTNLKDTFCQGNGPKVFNIQKQIVELHQGEQSITDYFTQLKVLWDQLQNFSPFPLCTWKVFLWHQSETCKSSSKGGSDEVPYGTQ